MPAQSSPEEQESRRQAGCDGRRGHHRLSVTCRDGRKDATGSRRPSLKFFGTHKMPLERTFAIIKPDAVKNGHIGNILAIIEQNGFRTLGMKLRRLSRQETEAFYGVHKDRPFFPGLVTFMTEGPVVLLALERRMLSPNGAK